MRWSKIQAIYGIIISGKSQLSTDSKFYSHSAWTGNCSQQPREYGCDWHYASRFVGQGRNISTHGKDGKYAVVQNFCQKTWRKHTIWEPVRRWRIQNFLNVPQPRKVLSAFTEDFSQHLQYILNYNQKQKRSHAINKLADKNSNDLKISVTSYC